MSGDTATSTNSIYERLVAAARANPAEIAIREERRAISYQSLMARAESIAEQLLERDCQVAEPIAIITNGGTDMIAAMIGSLQVAASFVPLDAVAPTERTVRMLDDLGSRTVIADEGLDLDPAIESGRAVLRPRSTGRCSVSRPLSDDSVIYGFFTSGSTGDPKCCLNTHLGLANRFAFNSSVRPLGVGDAILQNSKHTFDAVLWQTLWPLTAGATVVIPDRDNLVDIERTITTIAANNVVMTDIVPSVLTVLLDYLDLHPDDSAKLSSLTELFVGGEEISAQLVRRTQATLPWVRLTNTYGPTETAIGMIYHHFDGTESEDVPLGQPIPGATAVVVDEQLEPVADGDVGQLAIGGNCLGAGYHNDPAKTEHAFPTISTAEGRRRVFLTGDRAVVNGGRLYFRGRTDKQIKIRGVRVELKEVEVAFEDHPHVTQCRVVPVNGQVGGLRLHAFYTGRGALSGADLRAHAADRLPNEFIPSSFQRIDAFETTSSGKIDRARLQELATVGANGAGPGTAATITAVEVDDRPGETVTEVLEALVVEHTGVVADADDNLFLAGLDSLSAMRLALAIEERFSLVIPASQLYRNPTIAGIERLIDEPPTQPPGNRRATLLTGAAVVLLGLVVFAPSQVWDTLSYIVWSLSRVVYLVTLGIIAAAWITASGASKRVAEIFEGNIVKTILAASAIGAITPVCGLAILPVMAGLLATRVPFAPVMAFWLSSPITGPAVLTATAATLGSSFALGQATAAFTLGIFGGGVVALLSSQPWTNDVLRDNALVGKLGQVHHVERVHWAIWRDAEARRRFLREFLATSRLVLMALIPAFIAEFWLQHLLQPDTLSAYVGDDVPWAIPLTVVVGAPAYIDAFVALPLTRSLMDHGMSTGAAMSFLVSGGVVSIWGAIAIFPVLKLKPFLLYLSLAAIGSMAAGLVFGLVV